MDDIAYFRAKFFNLDKLIGKYTGKEAGPMLVIFGAMHGNEPAGVEAIKMILRELALEPYHNPDFIVRGSLLGLVGNLQAYKQNVRFLNKDLNRCWTDQFVQKSVANKAINNIEESQEIAQALTIIRKHVELHNPSEIYVLDIHTTSSKGGIFTITSDDQKSLSIGKSLHAPVVMGMMNGLEGTSMHFFNGENMGIPTTAFSFEAGQHEDILSPGRAYSAIVNTMKSIGMVASQDVENRHEKILIEFSKDLPSVTSLSYKFNIPEGASFVMDSGFVSFDKIKKGQRLATMNNQVIYSEDDGRILMPLYQKQGEEGFFIVKDN